MQFKINRFLNFDEKYKQIKKRFKKIVFSYYTFCVDGIQKITQKIAFFYLKRPEVEEPTDQSGKGPSLEMVVVGVRTKRRHTYPYCFYLL